MRNAAATTPSAKGGAVGRSNSDTRPARTGACPTPPSEGRRAEVTHGMDNRPGGLRRLMCHDASSRELDQPAGVGPIAAPAAPAEKRRWDVVESDRQGGTPLMAGPN